MIPKSSSRRPRNGPVLYVLLGVASVFVLVPVLWMIVTALKPETDLFSTPPRLWPTAPTLDAFRRVFTDYPFADYFRNSLIVVVASTGISLVFSSLSAYGVSRFKFRGRGSFLTFLLISQMFPSVMLVIPYFKIIQVAGLYNTYAALIVTYVSFTMPFCSWMMYGYFKSIPRDLDEAATIDGAGIWRRIRSITIPQIFNLGSTLLILQIIAVFQILYEPLVLTNGGPDNASISLMQLLFSYIQNASTIDYGKASSVSVILSLLLLTFTLFYNYVNKRKESFE